MAEPPDRPDAVPGDPSAAASTSRGEMTLAEFQSRIEDIYGVRDRARGPAASFLWLVEEVGELAEEVRRAGSGQPDRAALAHEFSDVLAWLCTMASMLDIEMTDAARRYLDGCPRCGATPCTC